MPARGKIWKGWRQARSLRQTSDKPKAIRSCHLAKKSGKSPIMCDIQEIGLGKSVRKFEPIEGGRAGVISIYPMIGNNNLISDEEGT
jgi:hypothetical protein